MEVRILSHICLVSDLGVSGNMYGGRLLYLLDEAAAIFAMSYAGEKRMVSRRFSEVEFRSPVCEGEILEFYADNPVHGVTSLTFDIIVRVDGCRRFGANCTFVAVDEHGCKKAIDWSKHR